MTGSKVIVEIEFDKTYPEVELRESTRDIMLSLISDYHICSIRYELRGFDEE